MSEKFRAVVATPEEAAKKLRKFIEKKKPIKYVKERRTDSDVAETAGTKVRDAAAMAGLGALKWSAWLAAGGSQFLLTLARWLTLDNAFLRKMEKHYSKKELPLDKNGKPKSLPLFAKKYPNLYAHILWFMGLAAVSGAAYAGAEYGPDVAQTIKEVQVKRNAVKFKDVKLDPNADDKTWQQMIDAVHPYVLAHIVSSEGFIQTIYDDNFGNGTLTLGSGFALLDSEHRKFAEKILGRRVGNGFSINIEENRILVSAWLYEKVYPKIRRQVKVPMDSDLFVILSIAGYNKGSNIYRRGNSGYPVVAAVNQGKSKEEIANLYVRCFGGVKGTQWAGLANKFAVSALYYLGYVDDLTILNAIAESPYTLKNRLLIYDSNYDSAKAKGIIRPDNIKDMLLATKYRKTKGTVQEPVRRYLTAEQAALVEKGYVNMGGATLNYEDFVAQSKKQKQNVSKTEKLNADGEDLFFEHKYKDAIKKFHAALEADEKNYIAYSNLAISYYKTGEYQKGLEVVQGLINSRFIKSMPADIKGYTYYNAALCRAAIGDNSQDAADKQYQYDMALKNLNLAKKFSGNQYQNFTNYLKQKLNGGLSVNNAKADSFKNATKKIKKQNDKFIIDVKLFSHQSENLT